MNRKKVFLYLSFFLYIKLCASKHNQHQDKKNDNPGFYGAGDKVVVLSKSNFKDVIFDQKYASYVEFYNSYCGYCRRFSPTWKEIAEDLDTWRDVAIVSAIDCSADENNGLCRDFEVMAYPTIRYFSPHHTDNKKFGIPAEGQERRSLRKQLVTFLKNETIVPQHWPSLKPLTQTNNKILFLDVKDIVEFIFIINLEENSTVGHEVALDLHSIDQILIRQVESEHVANKLGLAPKPSLTVVNRNNELVPMTIAEYDRPTIRNVIQRFASNRGISTVINMIDVTTPKPVFASDNDVMIMKQNEEIVSQVKNMRDVVFQADLEKALRYTLFHEVPKFTEITGEKKVALGRYIAIVTRYSPLGHNGRRFLQALLEYVMETDEINGDSYEVKIKQLENQFRPVFSSDRWVGCQPSSGTPTLRGFTCGLWFLFHYLTVQAAESETSTDPLEVLHAIHGYVKYFFGCSDCSSHFQSMAVNKRIWNVQTKDDAILWLWMAHNTVNKRLRNDVTEDSIFPKIKFPSAEMCPTCRRLPLTSFNVNDKSEWDKNEVLEFFKRIYSPLNISRLGVENEGALPLTLEALREKRLLGNVFTDMDMRMGIFLYLFCIGVMIFTVKFFLRRRYRRKMYSHDFLGKV
ncbi:sulfhydryl oxidase 1 [Bradysia coprophila]|uniref:sulfhydryl oxidase 1 n=1 Tax=Bradysia coprophila TaxID=38358 RepID=UPI00187DB15E|nr:sulfhydryl oxidase 1 [Bradysia coprophila]